MTEGLTTEREYVDLLQARLRNQDVVAKVKAVGVGKDPLRVVRKCIELRAQDQKTRGGFDVCVCLVDVDEHRTLHEAIRRAEDEGILLLVSNVKFEVWLYWHHAEKRASLTGPQLDRLMKEHRLLEGKNLSPSFPFDNVEQACRVARQADPRLCAGRIGPDPSSALPILVDLLTSRRQPQSPGQPSHD